MEQTIIGPAVAAVDGRRGRFPITFRARNIYFYLRLARVYYNIYIYIYIHTDIHLHIYTIH